VLRAAALPGTFDASRSERPSGHRWRIWRDGIGLAGVVFREPVVARFLIEVQALERHGEGRYGLLLRREPNNPHDRNALAVLGWAYSPEHCGELGYIPKEVSADIATTLPPDIPLAATLSRVFVPEPRVLWVGVRVLIPAKRDPWWKANGP
jgi:hypothetical protein